MELSEKVAAEKAVSGSLVYDASREAKVSERARAMAAPGHQSAAESLMRTVMRLSRERQYELLLPQLRHQTATAVLPARPDGSLDFVRKVSFGGTAGSYSEKAAKALFPNAEHVAAWSFAEACNQVLDGRMDAVVLPMANTSGGPVLLRHPARHSGHARLAGAARPTPDRAGRQRPLPSETVNPLRR
ncbi:MAG TPA: prephenate dehydratase domain-containing protein [Phycisphaerae bacterium]|nr:prephenate dehydratase domain-containing protein [Phycisphaerae bacterium]